MRAPSKPARTAHWAAVMMSSAGRPSRLACRWASQRATTIDVAMRIPYQRITRGPIWKAMAPGELITG